ncbi:MAG: hypothetical protein IJH28_01100 [Mogibacterium sp.]|nr:hypothetical protein [Mogibacterium sp.]
MNKNFDKLLRKLMCCSLVLALMLSQTGIVFAADTVTDEQGSEVTVPDEAGSGESPQVEAAAAPETAVEPETAAEETTEPENEGAAVSGPAVSEGAEAETVTEENQKTPAAFASSSASAYDAAGTIHIGDTSFDPEDEESSHWQDGKGWKNISGQYVAMVDYNGSEETITADGGVVTLAVAGVNRIGSLVGDCSIRIIGTGIVLIDNLELGEGNYLSLHPNTALYEEGSAAVFVKNQEDGSYRLINGEVTALLDEEYILENTNLTIPDGCNVVLGALSEVINGEIVEYGSRVIIGNNSTLTVGEGASVSMKKQKSQIPHVGVGEVMIEAELIIQGAVSVLGMIEGGFIDIENGGSLSGTGTVKSAEVCLEPAGNLDVSLDESTLTIKGNEDGSARTVAATTINNSIVYMKGSGIDLRNMNVSGSSTLSVDANEPYDSRFNKVGNITLSQGAKLDIAVNNYDNMVNNGTGYDDLLNLRDGLKDSYLEIYGIIKGGAVSVLAGCVRYTGTQTEVYPAVPEGYISRVIINGNGITSADDPLNMTKEIAEYRATQNMIPVLGYMVYDEWDTQKGLFRVWKANTKYDLGSVSRNGVSYPDLLYSAGLLDEDGQVRSRYLVAVELIYSDFSRDLIKASEVSHTSQDGTISWEPISLQNVVLIRVLEYWATGGFGGSSNTHVSSTFTGSGVIGGPGSGNMTTGSGTVVYGTQPEDPEPVNPTPDPLPIVPATYDSGNGVVITKTNTGAIVSGANTDALAVNVTLRKPTAKTPAGAPQVWHLDVTKAGVPVTDLKETPVRVTVPFTAPKDWGTPTAEEIAEYSLYAVFADEEGKLTAYAAQYDPENGEVWFDAEQTGDFTIVRFDYEKELFTEEFYKALAELEEVKSFLEELQKEAS